MRAGVRKPCTYQRRPTPDQERLLDRTLMRWRHGYNAARAQRRTWWGRGPGKGATSSQLLEKAELPDLKAACPEYAEVHAQVLHDVILRVERTSQAVFRRVKNGETPG